ncbi:MAG: hypothetical protein WCB46_11900 [Methanoregula sp.]
MPLSTGSSVRLAPPVACGGRLFVPLIRILSVSREGGGFGLCTPVALLIDEAGEWFFVSLDPDTTQECLAELELFPATGRSD